jgi:mRNA interferase RelE/StbE
MSYSVGLAESAKRELRALPVELRRRVTAALLGLAEEPRPRGARKLSRGPGWRLRVGDYRILYTVDDTAKEVVVYVIGHRRDVYRR